MLPSHSSSSTQKARERERERYYSSFSKWETAASAADVFQVMIRILKPKACAAAVQRDMVSLLCFRVFFAPAIKPKVPERDFFSMVESPTRR